VGLSGTTLAYVYDAYGTTRSATGTGATPFRFVGRLGYYYDATTGLYYLRARYYSAPIGKFLSQEPRWSWPNRMALARWDLNNYWYAYNNPVNDSDPSGLQVITPDPNSPLYPTYLCSVPMDITKPDNGSDCSFIDANLENLENVCSLYRNYSLFKSIDALLKECEKRRDGKVPDICNNKCNRLSFVCHGTGTGLGCRTVFPETVETQELLACRINPQTNKPELKNIDKVAGCISSLVTPGGYIRFCSCNQHPSYADLKPCGKAIANAFNRKVCFCTGNGCTVWPDRCKCGGPWECVCPD
jgi:RHS repeat-associated protein